MAEIQQPERGKNGNLNTPRCKKLSTKVDLTPMVDLGFLLITFFVFTTSMSMPNALKLNLPSGKNTVDSTLISESKTLNFILGGGDTLYYYNGATATNIMVSDYSPTGIRGAILKKMELIKNRFGVDSGMVVVIKPTERARYKNVVDAIDEMQINHIKTYFLVDATDEEYKAIASLK